MKKYSLLLLLGLLMVGCNSQDIEETADRMHIRTNAQYDSVYYETDTKALETHEELKQLVDKHQALYGDANMYYMEAEEDGYNYDSLHIDLLDSTGATREEFKPIISRLEQEVMPGITAFIDTVKNEKEDISPKVIVSQNNWAIMYPTHLYDDKYNIDGEMFTIGLSTLKVKDDYFNKLIEKVDTSQYVIAEPIVSSENAILQFSTPFYKDAWTGRLWTLEDDQYNQYREYKYGKNNMSFRLYIEDNKLEEIHVMVKQTEDISVDIEEFKPVIEWAKDEWQADEATLSSLQEVLDKLAAGELKPSEKTVGNFTYTYEVFEPRYELCNITEFTLKQTK